MGPEAKLWKALKPHLDAKGCYCTRVENRHGGGLPDVDIASPFGAFKVELKVTSSFSVRITDIQIAYNTLLNHRNGLSFILAEALARPSTHSNISIFEDQDPRSEDRGSVGSGLVGSGRGKSGRGPRTSVGSGRDRYNLFHGRDAVLVGREGLGAPALARGSGLEQMVDQMLATCRAHHLRLLEKAPHP